MSVFSFLSKKRFYKHLAIAVVITILLFILTLKFLDIYTHHGEAYIVPDFKEMTLAEIEKQNYDEIFDFIIIDSVYDNDRESGTVLLQNPSAGSKTKKGRNVYVTVVTIMPEITIMPELKDLSHRQAIMLLKSRGLKVGTLTYQPHFAENAVLASYHAGDSLASGTELEKGSVIDLVLGQGRNRTVNAPFLIGLRPEDARERIRFASFNVGKEYFKEDPDDEHSRVYRQSPDWQNNEEHYKGESIRVWYRSDLYYNFDSLITTIVPDTTAIDSLNIEIPEELFEE